MFRTLNSFRRIQALARLIILDGLRRKALLGLVFFALAGITSGLLFFDFIPRDIGRAANDFLFSITWLTGFIFLLFHAVQVTSWDHERGVLHIFLARPISRTEYALALFWGLATLLLLLNIILGGIGWGVLNFIRNSVENYFQHLSFLFFLLASVGMYWIQLIMLAIILLFSSAVRGSFLVLLLTLCYYFICSGLPVVRESFKQKMIHGTWSHALDTLLQGLTAFFPDFSWLDFKTLVASSDPAPNISHMTLPFVLSTLYVVIVLWLACVIYKRRDLQ